MQHHFNFNKHEKYCSNKMISTDLKLHDLSGVHFHNHSDHAFFKNISSLQPTVTLVLPACKWLSWHLHKVHILTMSKINQPILVSFQWVKNLDEISFHWEIYSTWSSFFNLLSEINRKINKNHNRNLLGILRRKKRLVHLRQIMEDRVSGNISN